MFGYWVAQRVDVYLFVDHVEGVTFEVVVNTVFFGCWLIYVYGCVVVVCCGYCWFFFRSSRSCVTDLVGC